MRVNLNPDGTGEIIVDGLFMVGDTEVEVSEQRVAFRFVSNERSQETVIASAATVKPELPLHLTEHGLDKSRTYLRAVRERHPDAMAFKNLTESYGFRDVPNGGRTDYGRIPTSLFMAMIEAYPDNWLQMWGKTMDALTDSWGADGTRLNTPYIMGLVSFLDKYESSPNFNLKWFKERLGRTPCTRFLDEVEQVRTSGKPLSKATEDAFRDVYNRHTRLDKNKI